MGMKTDTDWIYRAALRGMFWVVCAGVFAFAAAQSWPIIEGAISLLAPFIAAGSTPEQAYGPSREYFDAPNGSSTLLDRLLYTDLKTYLVELLMKQDQMSMAASIESRVPFLDHELVEFAARLPARMKLRGFRTKWILREAVRPLLPESILSRRKMGFPVPVDRWLRSSFYPLVEELVLSPRALARGLFRPSALQSLAREHRTGAKNHGMRLWLLINLELWHRVFLDREAPEAMQLAA